MFTSLVLLFIVRLRLPKGKYISTTTGSESNAEILTNVFDTKVSLKKSKNYTIKPTRYDPGKTYSVGHNAVLLHTNGANGLSSAYCMGRRFLNTICFDIAG